MRCGQAYVLELDNSRELIEVGDVYLPTENRQGTRPYRFEDFWTASDRTKRVMTVCTMVGCYFNCQFCSVRQTFQRNLTADEIVEQVDFLIRQWTSLWRSADPNESEEFHVLYTRMGEPSANFDNVIRSIEILAQRFPRVKIGMSTNGWEAWVERFLEHPKIAERLMMQFSIHGTDDETRSKMLWMKINEVSRVMDLARIGAFVRKFRKLNPRKISLNFILLKGEQYRFTDLKRFFEIEDVYIRLSPLNVTDNSNSLGMAWLIQEIDVLRKSPISSTELASVIRDLEECWFSYAYAPAIDEEIQNRAACGQALEILKKEGRTN